MTGVLDTYEANFLDQLVATCGRFDGVARDGYIALFKDTTGSGTAGKEPNDDGTLPSGLVEVTGSGYVRKHVTTNTSGLVDWSAAVAGGPTTKQVPKAGGSAITWTASGGAFGNLTAWGYYDASSAGNLIFSGPLTSSGTPVVVPINNGDSYTFDENNPIKLRAGDPAPGTVPT